MSFISRHIYALLAITTFGFLIPIVGIAKAEVARAIDPESDMLTHKDMCEVCHNGRNPHSIFINCGAVQRHLDNHPGDYAGPCENVTPEKPPKPHRGG